MYKADVNTDLDVSFCPFAISRHMPSFFYRFWSSIFSMFMKDQHFTDLFLQLALFGPSLYRSRLSSHHICPQTLLIWFTAVMTKLSAQFSAFGCCRSSNLRFCVPKTKNYKSNPIIESHSSNTAFWLLNYRYPTKSFSPLYRAMKLSKEQDRILTMNRRSFEPETLVYREFGIVPQRVPPPHSKIKQNWF